MEREETVSILRQLTESHPADFFKKFDATNMGISCVLRYLAQEKRPVSAGEISGYMHVSTARVAVLIRKMTEKELIIKETDADDARKVRLTLSEKGMEVIKAHNEEVIGFMSAVFERVGRDRIMDFISISHDIKNAVNEENELRKSRMTKAD